LSNPKDYSHSIQGIKGLRCSGHLDLLRGADAILVVLVHQIDLFFDPVHAPPGALTSFLNFFLNQGSSAVITFFVLSGYLVSLSLIENLRKPGSPWLKYAITRISRLHTVLIPSLVLCAAWDWLGMRLFGLHNVYGGVLLGTVCAPVSVIDRTSLVSFFGNILCLQNILVPLFGSNGALWSLSCEFWYYVLFPFLLCLLYPKDRIWWQRLLYIVLVIAGLFFIGGLMSFRFLIWLMGTALIFIPLIKAWKDRPSLWRYGGIVALIVFIIRLNITGNFHAPPLGFLPTELVLGITCMGCIYFSLHDRAPIASGFDKSYCGFAAFLASFSYTIYLLHMPLLFFIRAAFIKDKLWPIDPEHFLYAILIFFLVMFYAWLVSHFTEAKTYLVRRYLNSLFLRESKSAE